MLSNGGFRGVADVQIAKKFIYDVESADSSWKLALSPACYVVMLGLEINGKFVTFFLVQKFLP